MPDRKPWNHGGKTVTRRGYGAKHQKLRAILLAQEPLCRLCKQMDPPRVTAATIADHIVSIAKGGAIHDLANMQPVCKPCHDRKTVTEQGKRYRERKTIGLDGWPTDG